MTTSPKYPQPFRDADNVAFLEAWRGGRVLIQRCAGCGYVFFYPRAFCPRCWCETIEAVESAGGGLIVSFSLVYRPNVPAFDAEVPIILAEIELKEGARLLARIVDVDASAIRSGLAVEVLPPERATLYPLPVFTIPR